MRTIVAPLVWLGVLMVACDGGNRLTTPTFPSNFFAPGPFLAATYAVSGVVRTAGNVPVAGARVVVVDQQPPVAATTDGNGRSSLPAVTASIWSMAPLLSASKPGFFADIKFAGGGYTPISRDTQLDFELETLLYIAVGDTVRAHTSASQRVCSHYGYGTGSCHRFALTVQASGTLEVTHSAPVDTDVVKPDGTFAIYHPFAPPLRFPVEAGLTYEIRVATADDFELRTTLHLVGAT